MSDFADIVQKQYLKLLDTHKPAVQEKDVTLVFEDTLRHIKDTDTDLSLGLITDLLQMLGTAQDKFNEKVYINFGDITLKTKKEESYEDFKDRMWDLAVCKVKAQIEEAKQLTRDLIYLDLKEDSGNIVGVTLRNVNNHRIVDLGKDSITVEGKVYVKCDKDFYKLQEK